MGRSPCRLRPILGGLGLFASVSVSGAHAQSIDYASFEMLFGEPVTTSANGTPQRESDVALNMTIVTQDEIVESGARDIPQVLRRLAGLSVREFGQATTEVGIRGYNQTFSERLLVLVNGKQMYLEFFGLVAWDLLPVELSEIRQIEVVRGPNTALFGFNAVSGVVNIVTYNPLHETRHAVDVGGGSQNTLFASAATSMKLTDQVGLRLSAGGFDADEFDTDRPIPIAPDPVLVEPRRRSVAGELVAQVTDHTQVSLDGSYSELDRNDMNPAARIDGSSQLEFWSVRGKILSDTPLGTVTVNGYHNQVRNRAEIFRPNRQLGGLTPVNGTTLIQISDRFQPFAGHKFRLSTEYRHSTFEPETLDGRPLGGIDGVDYDIFSGSALWDWQISDRLNASTTVRFDRLSLSRTGGFPPSFPLTNDDFDQTLNEVGFNAGLVYKATSKDTLRLMASRGIDIPSQIEFGIVLPILPGITVAGDPRTEASAVHHVEVNYDRRMDSLYSDLRLALFYQQSNDQQTFQVNPVPTDTGVVLFSGNAGDSGAMGVEIALDGEKGPLSWRINYSYLDVDDDLIVNTGPVPTAPIDGEPAATNHTVNVDLSVEQGPWSIGTLWNYTSAHREVRSLLVPGQPFSLVRVPGNLRLDARLAYRVNDALTLSLVGEGLLESEFNESALAPVERRVWFQASVRF